MKLAIDLACMGTARTGAGVYVRELVSALKKAEQNPKLIELKPGAYPIKGLGPLGKVWNNFRLLYWIQHQLNQKAGKHQCDVLLSPEYLAPKKSSMPRMVVVFDAAFAKRPAEYNALWRYLFQKIYLPAMRSAEAVITITEVAKQEIHQHYHIDSDKIKIISPACDTNRYKVQSQAEVEKVLDKYQLKANSYFIHVGVMEKRKNLPCLVQAFARIKAGYPDMKLLLVGQSGPKLDLNDYDNIQAMIIKTGLQQDVLLPGFLPFEEVPLLYQGARAMVFPTLYEGFGIPLLEAIACGTPVACSNLDVLKEVAGDGANYFNPYSEDDIARAMLEIIEQPDYARLLKQNGRKQLARFSWTNSAKEIIALARQLTNNN